MEFRQLGHLPQTDQAGVRGRAINLEGNPGPARHYDLEYYARKMQAENMKNAKTFLEQGPLTVAGIENFDLWKKDILQAMRSVNLTEQEHWTTINKIIETCIDNNVY